MAALRQTEEVNDKFMDGQPVYYIFIHFKWECFNIIHNTHTQHTLPILESYKKIFTM